MRTTATSIVVVLLAASLAGCLSNGDASSTEPAEANPEVGEDNETIPELLELVHCDEQFAVFTTPASQAEAYLPEGFSLVGVSGEPLPEGAASLVVLTLDCQNPATDEIVTQLWVHLPVEAPEAYTREDALFHYIPVKWPVASEPLLETLHAWGIPQATFAAIQFDAGSTSPGPTSWETRASDADGGVRLATETVGNHPPGEGGVVRIFGVENGEVVGAVDFQSTAWEGALGVATLEDDGLVPIDVHGPSAGGLALDYDYIVTPVDLSDNG